MCCLINKRSVHRIHIRTKSLQTLLLSKSSLPIWNICLFFGYNYFKNIFWLYTLLAVFILSSILSGYHMGIENNIFNEFSGCTNGNLNITNKLELLKSLKNVVIGCKSVNFRILGLSIATINFIISLAISVIIYLIIKYEKK